MRNTHPLLPLLLALLVPPVWGTDIDGRVISADGKPIANAKVYGTSCPTSRNTGSWPRWSELRLTVTDANGHFILRNLEWPESLKAYERHYLLAVTESYAIGGMEWSGKSGEKGSSMTIRLAHPTIWKAIVIDEKGKRVSNCPVQIQNLLVNFTGKPMPQQSLSMGASMGPPSKPNGPQPFEFLSLGEDFKSVLTQRTNAKGEVTFHHIPKDSLVQVMIIYANYARLNKLQLRTDAPTPAILQLQKGGVIGGRVIAASDGKPRPGLFVHAQGISDPMGGGVATTDENGRFTLRNLISTQYNVMLEFPKDFPLTAAAAERVEVKPGQTVTGIELKLIEGGFIAGTVTDAATGKPLKDVSIAFYGPSRPKSGAAVEVTQTDENGRYRKRLPAGRNYVYYQGRLRGYAWSQPQAPARWVEVKKGQTTETNFALRQGSEAEAFDSRPAVKPKPQLVKLVPGTYTLRWQDFSDDENRRGLPFSDVDLKCAEVKPASVKWKGFLGQVSRRYASIRLGDPARTYAVVFEESRGKGKGFDALYADTDGDGDLSNEKKITGEVQHSRDQKGRAVSFVRFPPVTFDCHYDNGSRPAKVRFSADNFREATWHFSYGMGGYWLGEVDTDKGKMKIALADMSGQARYNQRCYTTGPEEKDMVPGAVAWLDRTLTGHIDDFQSGELPQFLGEAQLVCDRLYRFSPSVVGDRLVIDEYAGPTGSVKIVLKDTRGKDLKAGEQEVAGRSGFFTASDKGFPLLPAGDIYIVQAESSCDSKAGKWQYTFMASRHLVVSPEKSTDVVMGGPLKMSLHGKDALICTGGTCYRIKDTVKNKAWSQEGKLIFHHNVDNVILAEMVDQHGDALQSVIPPTREPGGLFRAALRNANGKEVVIQRFDFG